MTTSRAAIAAILLVLPLVAGCTAPFTRLPFWRAQEEIPITHLSLWSPALSPAQEEQLQASVDSFVASSQAVSVTTSFLPDYLPALVEATEEDELPDLFVLDSVAFPRWLAEDALSPLPHAGDADLYSLLRHGFADGDKLACYPAEINTLALIYNRDLFDAAELDYPSAEWTWSDLTSAAVALTDQPSVNYQPYGLALEADATRWLPFLFQAGGRIINEDGTPAFDTPEAAEALTFYTGLISDTVAIRPIFVESVWTGEAFGNRRVAMVIEGNWIVPYLEREFPELDYGIAPLPRGPAGRATLAFATCYAVAASSAAPEAAHALAAALTGSAALSAQIENVAALPARAGLAAQWSATYPKLRAFMDQLEEARLWQPPVELTGLENVIGEELEFLLTGEQSVREALAAIQSKAESLRNR